MGRITVDEQKIVLIKYYNSLTMFDDANFDRLISNHIPNAKKVSYIEGTFSSSSQSWERDNEITYEMIDQLVRSNLSYDQELEKLAQGFLKTETMGKLKKKGGKHHQLSRLYRQITDKRSVQKKQTREACLSKYQPYVPQMLRMLQSFLFALLTTSSREPVFFYGTYAFLKKLHDTTVADTISSGITTADIDCLIRDPEVIETLFQALVYLGQNYVFCSGQGQIAIREVSVSSLKYEHLRSFKLKYECFDGSCDDMNHSGSYRHCLYTGGILDCLLIEDGQLSDTIYQIGSVKQENLEYQGLLCYLACLIDKFYQVTEKPLSKQQIIESRDKIVKVLKLVASSTLLKTEVLAGAFLGASHESQVNSKDLNEILEKVFKTSVAKDKFLEYLVLLLSETEAFYLTLE